MSYTPEQIIGLLEDTASLLQKAQTNIKKCPKQRLTTVYIESRLNCIEDYWSTFKKSHQELVKITPREKRNQFSYFVNEDYFIIEDLYLCLRTDLKEMLTSLSSKTSDQTSNVDNTTNMKPTQVKLPRIHLPIFKGNYEDWPTFQDLFTSLVHECTSLSNVQKLHYLKTSVAGEAEALLKNIKIIESNYEQAWSMLKQRFGNKRLIVHSLLKRLFTQKNLTSQSANQVKSLLDTTTECLQSLKNLSISTDSWDPVIIFLVIQKLDPESRKDWETDAYRQNSEELPTWHDLHNFLESKYRTLELITPANSKERTVRERTFHIATAEKTCVMCKQNHTLCHCKEFTKLDPSERTEYVKNNNLCFNCLAAGHSVMKCRLPMSCRVCHRRHHSLLHYIKEESTEGQSSEKQPSVSAHTIAEEKEEVLDKTVIASHHSTSQGVALLATAIVSVQSKDGQAILLRALIDQGSQACFITERAAQTLNIKRTPTRGNVVGVGATRTSINQVVQVLVTSRWKSNFTMPIQAYVMSKQLTTKLPTRKIEAQEWKHLQGLCLADPSYCTPGSIDLLLGVKEYTQILENDYIKGPLGSPCAQKTTLGWILFGEVDNVMKENSLVVLHHQVDVNLDDLMKNLWEIDTENKRNLTKEERLCEDLYERTHKRNLEGRYIVKLPFKTNKPKSPDGNTRNIAMNRLKELERRFRRQPHLKEEYKKVIEDYIKLKHIEEVPVRELNIKECVYLPHHAVIRNDKETTKTRVVFDGSSKGSNGISLNDELLVGPVLQEDLRSIILRWRCHAVCFVADIQKMYRMILLTKEDTDFQRILWRADEGETIKDYRLLTVTFGTASAPYLAIKTLMQLAEDEGDKFPVAAKIIKEDFYVDDVISGFDTVSEAVEASKQLNAILLKGGFPLKKWASNSTDFMRSIEPSERSSKANIDINVDGSVKALGISWNLNKDQFQYTVDLPPVHNKITKRNVLSDIQKLYDPLGWIAPTIVTAKIFVQKLWLDRTDWDDDISASLQHEWRSIREDFPKINNIEIDRWLGTLSSEREVTQLHGFSDASTRAYAAVVYQRVLKSDGSVHTALIAARTRVAPLKTVSLPRLELCGALLLSRLLKHVSHAMRIKSSQIFAWTDSSIVISWLLGEPHKWKTFVANRVVEIIDNLNNNRWYYVKSQDNPADLASRGTLATELKNNQLWWKGPYWLRNINIDYESPNDVETELEAKSKIPVHLTTKERKDISESNLATKFELFNSLDELKRSVTLCIKFLKHKEKDFINQITTEDLEKSLHICIKIIQSTEFRDEIESLRNKREVQRKSHIKNLNPYLDEAEILRVGGRLKHSNLSYESKHPMILGHDNNLVSLIIADAHSKTLHGGLQLMLNYLIKKYWIIRVKSLVKTYIRKCLVCVKHSALTKTQIMGDLPKVRVTPARPFLHSGVDFAGPFNVLMSKGRGAKTNKSYVAIFICMAVKAIHLELVGDLSSEAFIGAFKRFVSRRGKCSHIWSDQGRNFVAANKELTKAWREAGLQFDGHIAELLASDGTQWHFIPAYSPNFGGLWEAGVKSMKFHLKRILTTNLTHEEMTTVLCEIEACLNSRPLCPIDTSDTDNIEPLTPGHFLVGEAPIIVPSPDLQNINMHYLTRWQYTQKLVKDFWRRWHQEYLSRLQQRPKWLSHKTEFKIGDIVLIKMENLPPGKWSLGRIMAKHPGPDGATRVYTVKSGNNIVNRCVTKLCLLPIEHS